MRLKFILVTIFIFLFNGQNFSQGDYFISSKDGIRLHIQEYGEGAPVIILAGGPGLNAGYMQSVWENLSRDYRCIVLHQRGTDQSLLPVVDSASMSMDNYLADLESLREYLNLKQLTLIGHSWGGMLSMLYMSEHPDRIEKALLLDPGGPSANFTKVFYENFNMRLKKEDFDEIKRLDSMGFSTLRARWPGYFYDRSRALATQSLVPLTSQGQKGVSNLAITNYFACTDSMSAKLKKTISPVYLIQGRQDPVGENTAMEIKKVLPQTEIYFIEECGHFPWLENERQINEFFTEIRNCLN